MKADLKKQIIEELEDMHEKELSNVYKFIHFMRINFSKGQKKTLKDNNEDPLSKVIGCCEGEEDLADKHDSYLYGM